MKGTISACLLEMTDVRYGATVSQTIVEASGLDEFKLRSPLSEIPDSDFMKLLGATLSTTKKSLEAIADEFGEFWCCTYAPRVYKSVVSTFKNSRDLLLGLDKVHVMMTKAYKNAHPPRFDYQWQSDNLLKVTYKSDRNMIDLYVGLARGVGKYFKERLVVRKVDDSTVTIQFFPA